MDQDWVDAMIAEDRDTISFLQKDIGVLMGVQELCGAQSGAGQWCRFIINIERAELEEARKGLKEFKERWKDGAAGEKDTRPVGI